MIDIPYDDLFSLYREGADALIESVNNTTVILYFINDQLTAANPQFAENPKTMDWLTGRVPMSELQGRMESSGTQQVQGTNSETIKGRVYWNPKMTGGELARLNIKDVRNTCKMITYIVHQNSIINSVYAIIDNHKCTRVGEPILHGLGTRAYITTYWEIVST